MSIVFLFIPCFQSHPFPKSSVCLSKHDISLTNTPAKFDECQSQEQEEDLSRQPNEVASEEEPGKSEPCNASGISNDGAGVQLRSKRAIAKDRKKRLKAKVVCANVDVIKDDFWIRHPWILSGETGR